MAKIRVTKEFHFEMAHALWNYDGKCKNIHGHSYKLCMTIIGTPINNPDDPKNGMVVDFSDIKDWVKKTIINEFDHSLLVNKEANNDEFKQSLQMFNRLKIMDFQPTCENLLTYMVNIIKPRLPETLRLHSIKLRETDSSFAEWYAEDNEDMA